jgi:hypothetical protein
MFYIREHTLTTIIDPEPRPAGWAGRWAGGVIYLCFTAKGANHGA